MRDTPCHLVCECAGNGCHDCPILEQPETFPPSTFLSEIALDCLCLLKLFAQTGLGLRIGR